MIFVVRSHDLRLFEKRNNMHEARDHKLKYDNVDVSPIGSYSNVHLESPTILKLPIDHPSLLWLLLSGAAGAQLRELFRS